MAERLGHDLSFYARNMTGMPSTILYLSDADWRRGANEALKDFNEESTRGEAWVINLVGPWEPSK